MYRKMATKITHFFIKCNLIPEEKKNIYLYGFEMLVANGSYLLIFVFMSILTMTFLESLTFWVGLFILRKLSGGHHANSYFSCHILSAAVHTMCILLVKFLPFNHYFLWTIVSISFSILVVLCIAPVDHKNKPFIKTEYKRFRKYSLIYSGLLILLLILYITKVIPTVGILLSFSFGTFSATLSLICAKFIRYYERRKEL